MDPVANIVEQRELAQQIADVQDAADSATGQLPEYLEQDFGRAAFRLADLVLSLDRWRAQGGFDPYTAGG